MTVKTMTVEKKNGKAWEVVNEFDGGASAYPLECYAENLTAKYIRKVPNMRVSETYHYDGTRAVIVDFGNGYRNRFEIKDC